MTAKISIKAAKIIIMMQEIMRNTKLDLDITSVFETVHNCIGDDGIIRKGAISCKENEKVLIPINMAYGSFIAVGRGNEDWNNSGPHGAGRVLSRSNIILLITLSLPNKKNS